MNRPTSRTAKTNRKPGIGEDGIIELDWNMVVDVGFYYVYHDTSYITSVGGLVPIVNITETNNVDTLAEDRFFYYVIVAGTPAENCSISNWHYVLVARDRNVFQHNYT